ncbi:hypothetical protein NQZ68_029142 [Dissostichus eleginoides]|nr:hypothetical protein NQZ68_029142 [Dissostichus eleginoides]
MDLQYSGLAKPSSNQGMKSPLGRSRLQQQRPAGCIIIRPDSFPAEPSPFTHRYNRRAPIKTQQKGVKSSD